MKCKNCKRDYKMAVESRWGFCKNPKCKRAQSEWAAEHFDELPEGKLRTIHEDAFYELTDVQREHYKTHQALIRKPSRVTEGRLCMKGCGRTMERQALGDNYHTCIFCRRINEHIGVIAQWSLAPDKMARLKLNYEKG